MEMQRRSARRLAGVLAPALAFFCLGSEASAQEATTPTPQGNASAPATTPLPAPAAGAGANASDSSNTGSAPQPFAGYIIPDAPAMTLLNSDVATINHPNTLSGLGAALVNVITPQGTIRTGVAIDVSLRSLGVADDADNERYRNDRGLRFASRLSFSLATTGETGPGSSTARLSVGARAVLWDESDPLLDPFYRDRAQVVRSECSLDLSGANNASEIEERVNAYQRCLAESTAKYNRTHRLAANRWSQSGWSVAIAGSMAAPGSRLEDTRAEAFGAWTVLALRLVPTAQLGFSVQYTYNRSLAADQTLSASARFRFGSERVRFSAEGNYRRYLSGSAAHDSAGRIAIGMEFDMGNNLWLAPTLAGDIDENHGPATVFALANLKWNVLTNSSF